MAFGVVDDGAQGEKRDFLLPCDGRHGVAFHIDGNRAADAVQRRLGADAGNDPVAAGDAESVHELAICCYRNSGIVKGGGLFDPPIHATMIRDERYKLSVYHDVPNAGAGCEGTLYDMHRDPNELADLWGAPQFQDIKRGLLQRGMDWLVGQELQLGSRGGEAPKQRVS